MALINRIKCFIHGHYIPGSPFINKQGCFTIKCIRCGKIEPLNPPIIDKDINHGSHTHKPRI